MAASLTAIGTIVVSDLAMAEEPTFEATDELPAPRPVKVAKVEHPVERVPLILEPGDMPQPSQKKSKKRSKVDFGTFEGY